MNAALEKRNGRLLFVQSVDSNNVRNRYCSRVAQTVTDFADASHSKSAKSVTTTVSYGIFSSENAYPCTVTRNNSWEKTIKGLTFHSKYIMITLTRTFVRDGGKEWIKRRR